MTTVPSVRFALPGRWVKAELDDPEAVSTLRDLLPDDYRSVPLREALLRSLDDDGAEGTSAAGDSLSGAGTDPA